MPITGFSHYNLRAVRPQLEELRAFYVEVVGLEVGARPPLDSIGYWLYAGGKALLHLSLAAASEGRGGTARTSFDHAAFECTGLAEFEAMLARRGIPFHKARVPGTTQLQLFFSDPAGNGVELNFAHADS
jgi:catechol-2,3-dioxygenase